jgi:hypothetical protein
VLPVLQAAGAEIPRLKAAPPLTFEANVETFLRTCRLPHLGQITSSTALALRTSSSNSFLHSVHSNSNIGIAFSCGYSVVWCNVSLVCHCEPFFGEAISGIVRKDCFVGHRTPSSQ